MGNEIPRSTVIIDECLPASQFREFFLGRGFSVLTVGEAFPSGSPDLAVLAVAEAQAAIVVTSDADWRTLLRQARGHQGRIRKAGRILFNCTHDLALRRLAVLIDDIEREIALAQAQHRRLLIRITASSFTVEK